MDATKPRSEDQLATGPLRPSFLQYPRRTELSGVSKFPAIQKQHTKQPIIGHNFPSRSDHPSTLSERLLLRFAASLAYAVFNRQICKETPWEIPENAPRKPYSGISERMRQSPVTKASTKPISQQNAEFSRFECGQTLADGTFGQFGNTVDIQFLHNLAPIGLDGLGAHV